MEIKDPTFSSARLLKIDVLRGFVMVIMALDHVREFWNSGLIRPEDVSQASVALFFTRWVTHLCAPTFVFLSGISIYLYQQQKRSPYAASVFLLTRGLWLIAIEVILMSPLLSHGYSVILMGIFWVIGASMILMALFIHFPRAVILSLAILMITGHNLLPIIQPVVTDNLLLAIIHNVPFFVPGTPSLLMPYTIIPWVSVMMLGYSLGERIYDSTHNNNFFLTVGISLVIAFLILRFTNIYGDTFPWAHQSRGVVYTFLSFLNVSKYPASLLFLCLTLGAAMIILALTSNKETPIKRILSVYGQVPFFFFVLHFTLISLVSLLWSRVAYGRFVNFAFTQPDALPARYEPSMIRNYLVWILIVLITYFPCKWFSNYKKSNPSWWLSYL